MRSARGTRTRASPAQAAAVRLPPRPRRKLRHSHFRQVRGVNLPSESPRLQLRAWGAPAVSLDVQRGEAFSATPESVWVFVGLLKVNFFSRFTLEDRVGQKRRRPRSFRRTGTE